MSNINKMVLTFFLSTTLLFANIQISNAANVSIDERGVLFLVYKIKSVIQEANPLLQTEFSISNAFRESQIDYGDYSGYVSKFYQNGVNYGQINFYSDKQYYVDNIRFISYASDDESAEVAGSLITCLVMALGMTPEEAMEMGEKFKEDETHFSIYCESRDCYFDFDVKKSSVDSIYIDLTAHN